MRSARLVRQLGIEMVGLPLENAARALYASNWVQTVYSPDQGESWRSWAGLTTEDTWLRFFRTELEMDCNETIRVILQETR